MISKIGINQIEQILSFDEYYKIYPLRRDELIRAVNEGSAYAVVIDEGCIGYGIFRPYGFLGEGYIHLLIIDKKYQRKGYAQQLIEYFETITQTKRIHTSTNVSNVPMQKLLEKLGYQQGGTLTSIEPTDPEIFYYKTL